MNFPKRVRSGLVAPISGCTTIDTASKPPADNGYLDCARAGNPGAGRDSSTGEAADSLLVCLKTVGVANIVGHGDAGIISTGAGQLPGNHDNNIEYNFDSYWAPYLRKLRNRINYLYLWGCHTGATKDGAAFVTQVAEVVNAAVAAPTGLVFCKDGDMTLEAGSTWQVGTPFAQPTAIEPPMPEKKEIYWIMLNQDGKKREVALKNVSKVEYVFSQRTKNRIVLSGKEAMAFLQLVRFDQPIQIPGSLGAKVSGWLEITFTSGMKGAKAEEMRKFVVYNNLILQDLNHLNTYYRCTEGFANAVNRL
jgi:hypothetical protein